MNSIRIGIDGNEANVTKRVGSNTYAFQILNAFYRLYPNHKFTIYLKSQPVSDMPPKRDNWEYRVITPAKLWTQWRLPMDLISHLPRPEVFYSPGHYLPRICPVPCVNTVMDLAFLKFPNLFLKYKRGTAQLTQWTKYSVEKAEKVITISQNSQKDIISTYGKSQEDVVVAYPGFDEKPDKSQIPDEQILSKYQIPPRYILYVGTIQPRKNLSRLLKAFEQLPPKFKTFHLVMVGQVGWMHEDFMNEVNQSPKKDKIKLIGFVETSDLPSIYRKAACSCLVSLYEGFGIPPLESLIHGTIPVVSNNSSLPEVVGEAGILVDPYSITSIRHGIVSAISESSDKKQLRLTIAKKHLKQFNWDQSAQKIMEVLYALAIQR